MAEPIQIESKLTGVPGSPISLCITDRDIRHYAAAIGDKNPLYFDSPNTLAPPSFAAALEQSVDLTISPALSSVLPELWNSGTHFSEYIHWHSHLYADDKGRDLLIYPSLQALIPRPGGCVAICRCDVFSKDQTHVCSEYHGRYLRGVQLDESHGTEPVIPVYYAKVPLWQRSLHISAQQGYLYEAAIPLKSRVCDSVHEPGKAIPGSCLLALCVRELTLHHLKGRADDIEIINGKFHKAAYADERVTLQLFGKKKIHQSMELFFRLINGKEDVIVSHGYIKSHIEG